MRLTEQLAVEDMIALGNFLLLPEDDLTLATVLKGPLFAFDEEHFSTSAMPRDELALAACAGAPTSPQLGRAADGLSRACPRRFRPALRALRGDSQCRGRAAALLRASAPRPDPLDEFLGRRSPMSANTCRRFKGSCIGWWPATRK